MILNHQGKPIQSQTRILIRVSPLKAVSISPYPRGFWQAFVDRGQRFLKSGLCSGFELVKEDLPVIIRIHGETGDKTDERGSGSDLIRRL